MPLLFYILFGAVLFGGGGALLYMMPHGDEASPVAQDRMASVDPRKQTEAAQDRSGEQATPATGADAPVPPSFDVVRIQKDGEGVIAGRAEPGWTVVVDSNEREVARTTADQFGEWTVVLEKPLPPGEHSIGLRAYSKGAAMDRSSEQHVSVSISGPKGEEQTVVALSKPGEATKVLTPKEPAKPAPGTQTAAREPVSEAKPEPETPSADRKAPSEAAEAPRAEKPAEVASRKQDEPKPAPAAPVAEVAVSFSAVDYEVRGNGSGQLFLSGEAASGTRVQLYLNNKRIGSVIAGPDGSWTLKTASELSPKTVHTMRADAVQSDGQVTSRAEVEFTPPDIAQTGTQVAAAEEKAGSPAQAEKAPEAAPADMPGAVVPPAEAVKPETPAAAPRKPDVATDPESAKAPKPSATPGPAPDERIAAAREPKPEPRAEQPRAPMAPQSAQKDEATREAAPSRPSPAQPGSSRIASADKEPSAGTDAGEQAVLNQKRSIVVRRGDTLWHIAERRYGSGIRYTAIYRDNRDQIRNPHWIYPGQEFSLPSN